MVYELIGTTGWTLAQIGELTLPQLQRLTRNKGRILYPRLKPELDSQFANYSSKPGEKGEESDTARLIREHHEREAALKAGKKLKLTPEQEERQTAYRLHYAEYFPPVPQEAQTMARPIPGLAAETAQAILDFAASGDLPLDIYRQDVMPIERELQATAAQAPKRPG